MPDADQMPLPSGPAPIVHLLLKIATAAVVPIYALLGWLIRTMMPDRPAAIAPEHRTLVLAVLCVVGFGAAAASFPARRLAANRATPITALVIAVALAETSALLGLVYYVLAWDAVAFAVLLLASFAAFAGHLSWNP